MQLLKRRISNLDLNPKKEDPLDEKVKPTDKFLEADRPQCIQNKKELELMQWIYSQFSEESECRSKTHIRRVSQSEKAHKARICPQWISTYNAQERTLLVWIPGTQNFWDWRNLLNVCHQPIRLKFPKTQTIWVHEGVYNAINNILFYAPLFADLHIHFSDPNQHIDRVIFGGHSQVWCNYTLYGAAIAQLMFILWHGEVQCAFVDYFRSKMSDIDTTFDPINFHLDSVYTLGAVSVISHKSVDYVDHTFGGSMINVIDALDPIPMMYGGQQSEPQQRLQISNKMGWGRVCINKYGQALLDGYVKVASFGPIGKYIVCVEEEFRVLHRGGDLYREHLVNGAKTRSQKVEMERSELPLLIDTKKHHIYVAYKANLDVIFSKYLSILDAVDNVESAVTVTVPQQLL